MIGVVDYGSGNITSVIGALERLNAKTQIVGHPNDLSGCEKLILPGVGAFGDGMMGLKQKELIEPLTKLVMEVRLPFLGICLGAQLITATSSEQGQHQGLNWIDAAVVKLKPENPTLRVPHVGWNDFSQTSPSPLFDSLSDHPLFYYVHSHHIEPKNPELVIGTCEYGQTFVAALKQNNIHAVQFHPEKSQRDGLSLLKNFLIL